MYETARLNRNVGTPLYNRIMDAAKTEANKQMNYGLRKTWNEADHELFTRTFFQLMKTHAGYEVK